MHFITKSPPSVFLQLIVVGTAVNQITFWA